MMAFALSQWERVITASNCDSMMYVYENDFLKVFLKGASELHSVMHSQVLELVISVQ